MSNTIEATLDKKLEMNPNELNNIVVSPNIINVEWNTNYEGRGILHATFSLNNKVFCIKPVMTVSSFYTFCNVKDVSEILPTLVTTNMKIEPDETMKQMSALIAFDFINVESNGLLDFIRGHVTDILEVRRQNHIKELTEKWNTSQIVKDRSIIEKFGGKLSFNSLEEYKKACTAESMHALRDIQATFEMKLNTSENSEIIKGVLSKHTSYGRSYGSKPVSPRFDCSYSWHCEGNKNMKLETAIAKIIDMLQSRKVIVKVENDCKLKYANKMTWLKDSLKRANIDCQIREYPNTDVIIFNNHTSMKLHVSISDDRCQIEGLGGVFTGYSMRDVYFTLEEVVKMFRFFSDKVDTCSLKG